MYIMSKETIKKNSIEYYYGIPYEGSTSAGKPLRKLSNVTCPYCGIKMIPGKSIKSFEKNLAKCRTAEDIVTLLTPYSDNMLPTEKAIFAIFKDFALLNPDDNIQNCLQMINYNCLTRLKLEEFIVLDDVDMITRKLSPETALKVREKTTKCREIIIKNCKTDSFKRRTFLESLEEIIPKKNEREILESIKDKALFLPTSGSSRNAFVVKYSKRTQTEIARRIFLASTATIEHITPSSLGGSNNIGNFVLASANGNRYRENLSLVKYINRFPKIPKYFQMYIDDIIDNIHAGALQGNEDYPYMVKKRIMEESEGRIMLSLSKFKYTEQEAHIIAKEFFKH